MNSTSADALSVIISPAADKLAAFLIKTSQTGQSGDPEFEYDALLTASGLGPDALADAADDLEAQGLVETEGFANGRDTPFDILAPTTALFAALDSVFGTNDPELDARRIAVDLLADAIPDSVRAAAEHYGWAPRRMNPAVTYLVLQDLLVADDLLGAAPWCQHSMLATRKLRWFVEGAL